MIYVPTPQALHVKHLERDVAWRAEYFNPVTGRSADLPPIAIDADGTGVIAPPTGAADWVLVLVRKEARH